MRQFLLGKWQYKAQGLEYKIVRILRPQFDCYFSQSPDSFITTSHIIFLRTEV